MKDNLKMNKLYFMFIGINMFLSTGFVLYLFILNNKLTEANPNLSKELNKVIFGTAIFIIILTIISISFLLFTRFKIVKFYDEICEVIDNAMSEKVDKEFSTDKETLVSKLQNKIKQFIGIVDSERQNFKEERSKLKGLISDISHQVKTPIANIIMFNDTLLQRNLNKEQEQEFLKSIKIQVEKLQWLMEALIKTSRLEVGVISLKKESCILNETIAQAISNVYIKAQQKKLHIYVNCKEDKALAHDKKWTAEALFNVLENAVKYTNPEGAINIKVVPLEIFTKIDISDTGMGIKEEEINDIFKRFYRGKEVKQIEGIGIGLYLTREIISKQGGYIKVKSKAGQGTTFSIFLPN